MGIGEEESYATVETKVCEDVPLSPMEESVSTVNISSYDIPTIEESVTLSDTCLFEIPTESGVEETLFLQPCQLFDVIDNCSSKMVDTLEDDVTIAVNSSSLLGCSGQVDDEGRDEKRVDCGSDIKCSGIESSHVEETVFIEDVSTTGVAVKSAVEEPEYLQTCQMLDAVDDCSRLPDLSGEDLIGIYNSLECFGQIDDVGRDDTCVDSRSEINCYGYVPSLITEDICDLNTDSFEIATRSVDACSPRRLDVLNLSGEDVSVALNSSTSVKFSGQTDIEGRDDSRVDWGSETKCSSVGPSYSRRSSRAHKPIIQTQTKTATRKCRKTTKVPCPDKNMEISFSGTRRKRSSVSKPARSSTWGILGNVNRVFIENNELVVNEVQSQELQKAKGSVANTKRNKDRASGNSKGSIKSYRASSSCIRLKVKLGNEVIQSSLNAMFPTVAATSATANATTNERGTKSIFGTMPGFSSLINDIEDKMGNEVIGRHNTGNSSVNCEEGAGEYCDEDLEVHLTVKDRDGSAMLEKPVGVTAGGYLGISSVDSGGVNTDPGTSPDSEVINLLQDAEVGSRCLEDLHDSVLTSNGISDIMNVNCKRGNRFQEDGLPGQEGIHTAAPLNTCESRQRVGNGSDSGEALTSFNSADDLTISSSSKECSTDPLPLSTETEVGGSNSVFKIENDREDKTFCSLDVGFRLPGSPDSKNLPPSKTKGQKLSKCSKSGGGIKGRSKDSDSARNGKGNACRKRENRRKSGNKTEVTKNVPDEASCKVEGSPETGKNMVSDHGTTNTIDNIESLNVSYLDTVSSGLGEQILPQRKAWVCCDDCHKWRRIPATLADCIGENSIWVCKDNMDKAFADCSIRQEKSNAEINAELELSDISGEEEASIGHQHYEDLECRPSKVPQPASFTCIPHNEYLHRNRKRQTIDEIMVCHCKPPLNGRMGCGDECLNRMLNIECVRGTCPCGDLCSNQQFQKREYAGMHWFPTGKKGYGLQLLDNVLKGQFLIEYVGEVLDMSAYEARQKQYASDGHKHFYFMTLNGSEVIDASAKGNVGRFINHSCDPNCRTEKWMINGEICIGLFALRDMKKGEEVTFDYNYVRVFGAAAKKCYCSSIHCQGYIGGDPSNTEVIVQGESDEEFPEPIMLFENGKSKVRTKNKISRAKRPLTEKSVLKAQNKIDESTTDAVQLQTTTQVDDCLNKSAPVVSELHSPSLEKVSVSGTEEISAQTEDVTSSSVSSVQEDLPMEDDSLKKCPSFTQRLDASTAKLDKLPDGITVSSKSKPETLRKRISSKLGHRMKTSRSSNSIKKGKVNGDSQNATKPQMTPDQPELQSIKTSVNGRFESVEVKLNELLDGDGGISKRKDAAKGYLKLLLLTAASGDSGNGEAIQSNRELSMILDALLKTKSRIVLTDVINKNGLRMLHNIMKQYRRDFKKIPILRKLLKILEYLAVREILTQEHINGGPPCPGMESFTESILSLTEHGDKQVHQIARGFRDKWIPRHLRRPGYIDRADGQEFHRGQSYNRFSASPNVRHDQGSRPSEAVDCVNKQAVPARAPVSNSGVQESCSAQSTGGSAVVPRIRKRKSRWDQPAEGYVFPEPHPPPHKEQKTDPVLLRSEEEACRLGNSPPDDEMSNVQDDAPPGFSSPPVKPPPTPFRGGSSAPVQAKPDSPDRPETATGHPQERFTSRIPVSYGIPLSIVKQFGASRAGTPDTWTTAPGIPFHPFPPLPPNKKVPSDHPPPPHSDQPVTPSTRIPVSKPQISHKRPRGANDLGNRYFRQQKSNSKIPPGLWKRNNNGWGVWNQQRNGVGAVPNNVGNSFRNMNCSEGKHKCSRVEKPNNCYHQPQPNHHHHYHHQH